MTQDQQHEDYMKAILGLHELSPQVVTCLDYFIRSYRELSLSERGQVLEVIANFET